MFKVLRATVIDILVASSLFLAFGHHHEGVAMSPHVICSLGPGVLDQRLEAEPSIFTRGGKADTQMADTVGGGCFNTARAAQNLGLQTRQLVLTGDDHIRCSLENLLRQEFPQAMTLPLLRQTRRSILCGDACATVRPPLLSHALPDEALEIIRSVDMVIMAPLTGRDTPLVAQVLKSARRSVLQLSTSQLADAETATQLSRLATWTIINRQELAVWSGCESVEAGLLVLEGLGVESLLVTSAAGVWMLRKGDVEFQAAFDVEIGDSTVGAGDVFAGTFAAMLAEGQPVSDSIRLAQGAAALHLSGIRVTSVQTLTTVVDELPVPAVDLPTLPFRRRKQQWSTRIAAATTAAASLLVGSLLGIVLT